MKENTQYSDIELQIIDEWESIGISNDFIFCKVMQDSSLLEELVRIILPDLKFIKLISHPQESVEIGRDIHGVRFDILAASEDGTVIEIEMQVISRRYLPKRMRYYESTADMQILEKGKSYSELKDSYIIMICPFDFFNKGRHIYTFTNRCKEDYSIELGDGTTKIFLNSAGTLDDISDRPKLKAFLNYIAGIVTDDKYIQKLDNAVKLAKMNKVWRREYMTLKMRDLENQEIGEERGRAEGRAEGKQETLALSIKNIVDSFDVSVEKAMDSLKIPQDQRSMYMRLIEDF